MAGNNYLLSLYINFQGPNHEHGWLETYWLNTSDLATALTQGFDLANRRRLLFATYVYTAYACVSQGTTPLDTFAVPIDQIATFPVNLTQPLPPNDPWIGLYYNVGSPSGRYGQRVLKGVPDDWIRGLKCVRPGGPPALLQTATPPPLTLGAAPPGVQRPLLLAPGQTLDLLQRSFLDAAVKYTGFITKTTTGAFVEPIDYLLFSRPTKREARSDFGWLRVSVEPGLCCVNGFWVGPTWDFCGMCVGVSKVPYYARARWFVDGPVTWLRFYRVPQSNPPYLGQLRFGPKTPQGGYWNTQNAGEITSIPSNVNKKSWTGYDVSSGLRDGTHPDVTAAEAAGQAPWLWPSIYVA